VGKSTFVRDVQNRLPKKKLTLERGGEAVNPWRARRRVVEMSRGKEKDTLEGKGVMGDFSAWLNGLEETRKKKGGLFETRKREGGGGFDEVCSQKGRFKEKNLSVLRR